MIKKIIKDNYLIIYSVYFIVTFLEFTTITSDYQWISTIVEIIKYITFAFFALRLFFILPDYKRDLNISEWKLKTKVNKFAIVIACIIFISAIINFIVTQNKRIILLLVVLLSSYKVDYKKIIKQTMILQIILTSFTVLMSTLGITQNYTTIRNSVEKVRYSLGFKYATQLAQMILFSSLLFLYNKNFKVGHIEIFTIQTLNVFVYFITDSKTEFILLELIIILVVLSRFKVLNKIGKKIMGFLAYSFHIYPIISFILGVLYPLKGIFSEINRLLSGRLKFQFRALEEHGITLFGDKIEFVGNGLDDRLEYGNLLENHYNFVDNEYVLMIFKEGLIITICFIIIMSLLVIMLYNKKKYKELFLCAIYLVFGLINPRIISLIYSPILFLIIPIFTEYFKSTDKGNEESEQINKI